MRKVFIAGGASSKFIGKFHPDFIWKGHPDFGKRENPSLEDYVKQPALDALKAVGADPSVVDRGYVGNFAGELFDNQGHLGAVLAAAAPALEGKPIARLEGACASGGLALAAGIDAIHAGAEVVLVVGAEVQTTVNAKIGADYLARAAHYKRQRAIDPFTFPCLFAKRAKAIIERTETTLEDCARVAVKAYANGNRNPLAHMVKVKMSLAQANTASDKNPLFLEHVEYKEFLRVSDCSQVSDGGSAIVLCSEDGLQRIGRKLADAVEILTCQVATASIAADPDPIRLANTAVAAHRAYQATRLTPKEIGVAEVHDCFTVNEILMYEALGFAEAGRGARLIRDGESEIGGRIPVNTGGGLVAFGHPVGATGVKQALEIFRQLKGQCGDYQVKKTPTIGLSANMGGDDRTSVVAIYRNA
jgi:acetyl-CoA acetyltransferase